MSRREIPRIPDTFGAWIYEERKKRNWNQEDLAKRAGISKSWISSLERNTSNSGTVGYAPRPEADVIDRIADAFQLDADEWRLRLNYGPRYATHDTDEESGNTIVISQNRMGQIKIAGTPPAPEKIMDTVQLLREEATLYRTAADRLEQTAKDLEQCAA